MSSYLFLIIMSFRQEDEKKERIVVENADWLGLVPYWAVWPYETMIIPRNKHILRSTLDLGSFRSTYYSVSLFISCIYLSFLAS